MKLTIIIDYYETNYNFIIFRKNPSENKKREIKSLFFLSNLIRL